MHREDLENEIDPQTQIFNSHLISPPIPRASSSKIKNLLSFLRNLFWEAK
jgi:hypothetical protein